MIVNPLYSLDAYSEYIAELVEESSARRSTISVWSASPHPNDPSLASTHPHHKHIPPNIKRNRIPAPGLSFTYPNLPQIVAEIEELVE